MNPPVTLADIIASYGFAFTPTEKVLIFIAAAFGGMLLHWAKKRFKDGHSPSFVEWFFRHNFSSTLMAVGALSTVLWPVLQTFDFGNATIPQLLSASVPLGYACDSGFNEAKDENADGGQPDIPELNGKGSGNQTEKIA